MKDKIFTVKTEVERNFLFDKGFIDICRNVIRCAEIKDEKRYFHYVYLCDRYLKLHLMDLYD